MPLRRLGPDRGDTLAGPVMISDYRTGMGSDKADLGPMNWRIRSGMPPLDFTGAQTTFTVEAVLGENTNNPGANILSLTDTQFSIAEVVVPRGGRLVSASFIGSGGIAADNTNFVTFTVTNKLGAGSGSGAMLAATQDTKAANLNALTSLVPKALNISLTAAALRVAAGDVLEVKAVTAGTLGNAINAPKVVLTFATIPYDLTPLISRIAGTVLVAPVDGVANGEITGTLGATSELQAGVAHCGDKLDFIATYGPILRARVKLGTIGANERFILGFGTAYNATWDSVSRNAWFRCEGSMVLKVETDDNTTDNALTAYLTEGLTLVAGVYYWFTVDMTDIDAVKFQVDDYPIKTLPMSALAVTDFLQPIIGIQKSSGTGVPSWTCDFLQAGHAARA